MEPTPLRVLIAEDEVLVALGIERKLRRAGVSVVGRAYDGRDAVELTCKLGPDAVLMDVGMPTMDGIEATREIRRCRPTPVVLLTAHGAQEAADMAAEAGAEGYLTKPAGGNEMLAAIRAARARFEEASRRSDGAGFARTATPA